MLTKGDWRLSDERECHQKWFASIISHPGGVEIAKLSGGAPYRNGEGLENGFAMAAGKDLLLAAREAREALAAAMRVLVKVGAVDEFAVEAARIGIADGIGIRLQFAIQKAEGADQFTWHGMGEK